MADVLIIRAAFVAESSFGIFYFFKCLIFNMITPGYFGTKSPNEGVELLSCRAAKGPWPLCEVVRVSFGRVVCY